MNDNLDEELQHLMEQHFKKTNVQESLPDHPDARLYESLFRELADDSFLPEQSSVADKVFVKLEYDIEKKEAFRYRLYIVLVIMAGALFAGLAITLVGPDIPALTTVWKMIQMPVLIFIATVFCITYLFGKMVAGNNVKHAR